MTLKTPSVSVEAPVPATLSLPEELTIYTAGELHPRWLEWLQTVPAEGAAVDIRAESVDQVDAAGLQLLLALERALTARGATVSMIASSAALRSGCEAIGLASWLQSHEATEGAQA